MMRFSIVVPAYNASKTIEAALDSCLKQRYLPEEIIVIDDASSDDTYQKAKRWAKRYGKGVKVVCERLAQNAGPSKARNRGWDLATGDYIAFLDADDRFLPKKLESVAGFFEKNKDAVLLGHVSAVEDDVKRGSGSIKRIGRKEILFRNIATTPSIVVKREIEARFDESMRYTEDHDLWLRITEIYDNTFFLDSVLTLLGRAVRSKGGQSGNQWAMRKGEMRMYAKYCRRNDVVWQLPFFVLYSVAKHTYKWRLGELK